MRYLYESTREYPATQSYTAGLMANNDVVPVDVPAVLHGKGKKVSPKGKQKWKVKGKAKDEQKGGKGKPTEKFDGECSYCGKWGHKRADCRKKSYDEKGIKGTGKSSTAAAVGVEGAGVSTVIRDETGDQQAIDGWAFAVQVGFVACSAGSPGERLLILGDSGSDEHLCPQDFA